MSAAVLVMAAAPQTGRVKTRLQPLLGKEGCARLQAELPFALLGFATDYANGVSERPTPVEELLRLIEASTAVFASVLARVLPKIPDELEPAGVVYRFEE